MFDTPATTPSPIPPDIFEDILDHLPTVADLHTLIMTCRLWHLFGLRHLLRSIKIKHIYSLRRFEDRVTNPNLPNISQAVREIYIHDSPDDHSAWFAELFMIIPDRLYNVSHLRFQKLEITKFPDTIRGIAISSLPKFNSIDRLTFDSCIVEKTGWVPILQFLPGLSEFRSFHTQFTGSTEVVLSGDTMIHPKINLVEFSMYDFDDSHWFFDNLFGLKNLQRLCLNSLDSETNGGILRQVGPQLRVLELNIPTDFKEDQIDLSAVSYCKKLDKFHVSCDDRKLLIKILSNLVSFRLQELGIYISPATIHQYPQHRLFIEVLNRDRFRTLSTLRFFYPSRGNGDMGAAGRKFMNDVTAMGLRGEIRLKIEFCCICDTCRTGKIVAHSRIAGRNL